MVLAVFSVGCCGSSTNVDTTGSTNVDTTGSTGSIGSAVTSTNDLELIEDHVESGDFGTKYVVGQIKNNADKTYSYVQVTINLYDDSGAQIGSTLDNLNNFEPGGVWKFKAMIFEDDATTYKIKEITGF